MKSEERFKQLLRELFQSERADLDFGIYRVMNQKREALEEFIENGIVREVKDALQNATAGEVGEADVSEEDWQKALDWLKVSIGDNFDDKGELKQNATDMPAAKVWQMLQGDSLHMPPPDEEMRKNVYNNLHTFFARYYDDGDFMCKQRYSANGRYAVPYNGEETLLHWANKDQYYIKTAEYFLRYEFKLPNGKPARFEMREAELERDNNKGDKKKYFIPLTKEFSADKNGCVLPFEYRPLTDAEKKKYGNGNGNGNGANKTIAAIAAAAVEALTGNAAAAPLLQKAEGGKALLSLQMQKYVKLNTADFFIHKNLGKFLREELDYYINKELLVAEEQLRNNANSRARAAVAQATKAAGEVVIDFLAQLENYQKAIWEKKKFVVDTNYIITLQEIEDKALRDIIAKNDAQWREWKELNFIPDDIPRLDFMDKNPTLPVDTKHFDAKFKRQWLATVDGLDDKTDGVLFHCENWQALNLLQGKYRGKVKCVYIDPPYNTGPSEIIYKNNYKHSSWLSLMHDRILHAASLLPDDGIMIIAIDDNEHVELMRLLNDIFPSDDYALHSVTVKHNPQGVQGMHFAYTHEYAIFVVPKIKGAIKKIAVKEREQALRDDTGNNYLRTNAKNCFYPIFVKGKKVLGFGDVPADDFHPAERVIDKGTHLEIWPIREGVERKWRYARQSVEDIWSSLEAKKANRGVDVFQTINFAMPKTVWDCGDYAAGKKYGTGLLSNFFADSLFDNPKSVKLVEDCVFVSSNEDDIILDYFAGSGTTAHAVINLNRKSDGRRKFILAEMGEYFQTVIVPRVKKVIFTPEWEDGKFVSDEELKEDELAERERARERAPRIVKYHRLESYEDALENIRFDEPESKPALLYDDYAPRYMLQAESGKSSTFAGDSKAFQKPFNYTLQKYNAGKKPAVADLPETFAYLIGLQEKTRQFVANGKIEYVIQRGTAEGKETAVLWRNTENWKEADYQKEVAFVEKQGLTANAEQIFANDESRIKGAASLTPIFAAQMFGENDE